MIIIKTTMKKLNWSNSKYIKFSKWIIGILIFLFLTFSFTIVSFVIAIVIAPANNNSTTDEDYLFWIALSAYLLSIILGITNLIISRHVPQFKFYTKEMNSLQLFYTFFLLNWTVSLKVLKKIKRYEKNTH